MVNRTQRYFKLKLAQWKTLTHAANTLITVLVGHILRKRRMGVFAVCDEIRTRR